MPTGTETPAEHLAEKQPSTALDVGFRYLQVFDGLFGHQLFLLVPLDAAHHAGPDDADHGLL